MNIETARNIAFTVVAANVDADHLKQTGYKLDISDKGRFWLVTDGPNIISGETVEIPVGGSTVRFHVAKCSGSISDFSQTWWR